jgi:catechol 2,3-dioxygenase-like lactoylglutathione lyase family enzyme
MSIFTHVVVGTNDKAKSTAFYDAALAPLGVKNLGPMGENGVLYGAQSPEFLITKPANGQPACHANGGTIGFHAPSRAAVRAFHAAGVANGGTDEGAPGPRSFTPTAYAAYLRDPCGNKICAYCFEPGE